MRERLLLVLSLLGIVTGIRRGSKVFLVIKNQLMTENIDAREPFRHFLWRNVKCNHRQDGKSCKTIDFGSVSLATARDRKDVFISL